MTTTNAKKYIHPVLNELGLLLPMRQESYWALSWLEEEAEVDCPLPELRFTLAADNDLIVEFIECAKPELRYIFDKSGRLVSMYRGRMPSDSDAFIKAMRTWAITTVRSRLGWQRK